MNIFELANIFLSIEPMTNKKLQKLCYYAQAWHLALNNEPLVDTRFEAWIHGPVCPELYHQYKRYGSGTIPGTNIQANLHNDQYTLKFINSIYDIYGNMSGDDLEFLTHKEDPWMNAREGLEDWESSHNIIHNNDMREYYSSWVSER